MTDPTSAGDGLSDLGKAAKGLSVPGKALVEHHHPFQFASPLAHEQSSRVEANSVPGRWLAIVERTSGEINRSALRSANNAQRCFIEIAKRGRLTPVSQNPQEQPARQVSRSRATQMITPLKTKLVGVESGEARDSRVERFSLSRRRRLEGKTLSEVAGSPFLRHHAACCASDLSPRPAFFDCRAGIAGGASLWPVAPPVSIVSRNRARYVEPRSMSCRSIVTAKRGMRKPIRCRNQFF